MVAFALEQHHKHYRTTLRIANQAQMKWITAQLEDYLTNETQLISLAIFDCTTWRNKLQLWTLVWTVDQRYVDITVLVGILKSSYLHIS